MDNQVPLNIIINTIAAIVTGIGINWLYDYLRYHEILPEVRSGARIGVRFLLFLLCIVPFAYLSIYPLTDGVHFKLGARNGLKV